MNAVHPQVRKVLARLMRTWQSRGVDVFLFGSVAETWPPARKGADLDIGFDSRPLGPAGHALARELARDMAGSRRCGRSTSWTWRASRRRSARALKSARRDL
jgi:hypothetical protein